LGKKKQKKMKKKHVGKVKAEFSTSSILKKKLTKIILKKICGETLSRNKNLVEKHCNNPQCFKEKNYEAKSTNIILKKKIHKKKVM
jgi:hypothetical protein